MLNRLTLASMIGFFALALAGSSVAFAQDDDDDDVCGDVCGDDGDDMMGDDDDDMGDGGDDAGDGGDDAGDGGDDAGDAGDGGDATPATGGDYPVAFLARPRVIPAGSWEAGLDVAFINAADVIAISGVTPGSLGQTGGLSFQYGIMDKLSAGLSYGFTVKEFEIKGGLNLNAQYLVMRSDSLQLRADASLGYNLALESLGPIGVGATVQYNLGDKMAVFTSPAFVVDNKLDFGLGIEIQPIYIRLPVGFGYQVSENIYAQLDTLLAIIEISDSNTGFIGADFLPLNLTAMYSANNMLDIGANVGFGDLLNNAGDNIYFGLMARYRGGL